MRFVVYGAGAIGGVIGARLFEHGHDVALLAAGAHLDAIKANGLRIESAAGSSTLAVPAAEHPAELELGSEDVVVLAMKSQDTIAALEELAACAPVELPVVCAQNGVANERVALRFFPNVYGMCVMCPTGHLEPGVVEAYSSPISGLLDVGCYPNGVDRTAEEIAAALACVDVRVRGAAGHHALEVPEAAAEPRQRGRGRVRSRCVVPARSLASRCGKRSPATRRPASSS